MEGIEYYFKGDELLSRKAEETKKQISKMTIRQIQEQKLRMLARFLDDVSKRI